MHVLGWVRARGYVKDMVFILWFFLVVYIEYMRYIYVCTKPHADRRNNKKP